METTQIIDNGCWFVGLAIGFLLGYIIGSIK